MRKGVRLLRVRIVREFDNGNLRVDFDADNKDGNKYHYQFNIPKVVIQKAFVNKEEL